jgi:hypothetical protein
VRLDDDRIDAPRADRTLVWAAREGPNALGYRRLDRRFDVGDYLRPPHGLVLMKRMQHG